jgi:hypothetical protein
MNFEVFGGWLHAAVVFEIRLERPHELRIVLDVQTFERLEDGVRAIFRLRASSSMRDVSSNALAKSVGPWQMGLTPICTRVRIG